MSFAAQKILVVEDNVMIQRLASRMLGLWGYRHLQAVNGQEAMDIFKRDHAHIDLVIMDLNLPDANGLEVYEKFKQMNRFLPLILTTGCASSVEIHESNRAYTAVLPKPFTMDALQQSISAMLSKPTGFVHTS